jgi:hypothetical protein
MAKKPGTFTVFTIVTILIALIVTFVTNTKKDEIPEDGYAKITENEGPLPPSVPVFLYSDETYGFEIPVPTEWEKVRDENSVIFIKRGFARIKIAETDYNPAFNAANSENAADLLGMNGKTVIGFKKNKDGFETYLEQGDMCFLVVASWDREKCFIVTFETKIEDFGEYYGVFAYASANFTWKKKDPMPEGFSVYYDEERNFEFGVPDSYTGAAGRNSYAATNAETGSVMHVETEETSEDFKTISEEGLTKTLSENRNGLLLKSYMNGGIYLTAEAEYVSGGVITELFLRGTFTNGRRYIFIFECKREFLTREFPLFEKSLELFEIH